MTDDAQLIRQARAGDLDAFEALARRHQAQAYAIAYPLTGQREEAEDVVQDSLLKLYLCLDRYRAPHPFGAWFARILVNTALDRRRQSMRRPTV